MKTESFAAAKKDLVKRVVGDCEYLSRKEVEWIVESSAPQMERFLKKLESCVRQVIMGKRKKK